MQIAYDGEKLLTVNGEEVVNVSKEEPLQYGEVFFNVGGLENSFSVHEYVFLSLDRGKITGLSNREVNEYGTKPAIFVMNYLFDLMTGDLDFKNIYRYKEPVFSNYALELQPEQIEREKKIRELKAEIKKLEAGE